MHARYHRSFPRRFASSFAGILVVAAAAAGSPAHAEQPAPAAGPAPAKAAPAKAAQPKAAPRAPLPVTVTVVAPSPDPPWKVRVENVGDQPIRIAADIRLLSFEVQTKKGAAALKCAAPGGLRPKSFPDTRQLVLKPGEAWEEQFDPRLFCFGEKNAEALRGGSLVRPRFGWARSKWQTLKEPFAAQGLDRPEAFSALTEIAAPPIVLSYRPKPPLEQVNEPAEAADAKLAHDKDVAPTTAAGGDAKKPKAGSQHKQKPQPEEAPVDRNAGHVEIYVDRFSDAAAPRDLVMTIRAANEGKRQLTAVLRGRMLAFTVEQLGPDNRARSSSECIGSQRPHAIPTEMVRDYGPGDTARIPLLLAEICPKTTFDRPGLYRVTARIDTAVEGESLKHHPYIGQALALQPALLRVATSKETYYEGGPSVAPPPPADETGEPTESK